MISALARRTPDTPSRAGHHAVVLGAGMAGLLAAGVLAESFDRVTVVERDPLPGEATPRRGVPQGKHIHVLLSRGAGAIDEIFPGILTELTRDGGATMTNMSRLHMDVGGRVLSREDAEFPTIYMQTRPFLETHVLARVRALSNVTLLDQHDVAGLQWDASDSRVVGVEVAPRPGADAGAEPIALTADLVVAAMGRNGRVGAWLSERGYDEPAEEQLRIDLVYATRLVRMDPVKTRDLDAVVVGSQPERPSGVGALRQENDRWVVTLEGYAGHHPPTDPAGWLEAAIRLSPPDLAHGLRDAAMVSEVSVHRFPANLWRRYDKLSRFPDGLLVTGDAVCSFNPVYGQGMTIAALEALALRDVLRAGTENLAARFFKRTARPVKLAWQAAVGGDLAMPPEIVAGPRPVAMRVANAYLDRYLMAAEHDAQMTLHFINVSGLDEPTASLFRPHALRQMIAPRRRPQQRAHVSAG